MIPFRRLAATVAVGFLATAAATLRSATGMGVSWAPVSVVVLGPNRLAVLSRDGQVFIVAGGVPTPIGRVPIRGQVNDMAGTSVAGREVLLVSSTMHRAAGDVFGQLQLMAVNPGGQAKMPMLLSPGGSYTGLAWRPGSSLSAFAAEGRRREIHTVEITGTTLTTRPIGYVPDTRAGLGAIGVDLAATRVFALDVLGGTLWMLPTKGGTARLFAQGLRDPRAIAIDATRIFVADGESRRIVRFDLPAPGQVPTPPLRTTAAMSVTVSGLAEPAALAIAGPDQLWIGDPSAAAIFYMRLSDRRILQKIVYPR